MPVYRFQGSDGQIHRVEADTPEAAQRGLEEHFSQPPSVGSDVVRSIGSGLTQIIDNTVGQFGDAANAGSNMGAALVGLLSGHKAPHMSVPFAPTAAQVGGLRQALTGQPDHVPQTVAGQYAHTIAQFLPAALMPGGAAQRVGNVIIPALASETAGQVTKGSPYEGAARLAGGLVGGAFAPAASSRIAAKVADAIHPEPVPVTDPALSQPYARKALQYVDRVAKSSGADIASLTNPTGKPLTSAEVIGRPAQVALGALARRSGATPDALAGMVAERQLTRPARILGDVGTATGITPEAAAGDMDALISRQRAAADPLFKAALSDPGPVWNADLANLAKRPVIQRAMGSVSADLQNAGKDPTAYGIAMDPATGAPMIGTDLSEIGEHQPTAEAWDMVRKAIGRQIVRHPITGKPLPDTVAEGNFGVRTATQDLTKALAGDGETPGAIPGYRAALDHSADYLSAHDAFAKGQTLLTDGRVTEAQLAQHFNGLTPAEQDAYRGGVANKFFDLAQNGRLDAKVLKTPRMQAKLQTILGPDQARQLTEASQSESAMKAFEQRYGPGGGSPTQEFNAAMAEQDGGNGLTSLGSDFGARLASGQGLNRSATDALLAHLKKLGAVYQTRGMPVPARDEAGRLLMMSPEDLTQHMAKVPQRPTLFGGKPIPSLPSALIAGLLAR